MGKHPLITLAVTIAGIYAGLLTLAIYAMHHVLDAGE